MAKTYKIMYTGQLQDGVSHDKCITAFSKKFAVSENKARKLVTANKEVLVKNNIEADQAKNYQQALESCGMIVRLEEINSKPLREELSIVPIEEDSVDNSSAKIKRCPKCGSETIIDDECQKCGIFVSKYQQALDKVTVYDEPDNTNDSLEEGLSADNPYEPLEEEYSENAELNPLTVPASHGVSWLSDGFWHFKQNKLAWAGVMVICLIIFVALSFIPFAGSIIVNILSPVILGSLLIGAHEQAKGGDFQIAHLLAGFLNKPGQLILVGVIYLVATLLIMMIAMAIVGGSMAMSGILESNSNPELFIHMMGPGMMLMMLPFWIIMTLMFMAYWYAPVLVTLEGMSALSAMALSFRTCLKNWRAFTIYGMLAVILLIIAIIPLGLGLPIVLPVLVASIYASYRDVFQKA
jgi:hypothetical protein